MDDTSKRLTYSIRIRPDIMDKMRHLAVDEHVTLSSLIERALEELLERHEAFVRSKEKKNS